MSRGTRIQLIEPPGVVKHLGQRKPERLQGLGQFKTVGSFLSVSYFQKEKLVITIKRPYYIADFLGKSVFYWAGLQTHSHTLLATTPPGIDQSGGSVGRKGRKGVD